MPIAEKIQRTTHAFPPIEPMIPPTMPVMSPATMITPTACQKCPFTRFHDRLSASVPRRFSTISTGTETDEEDQEDEPGDDEEDEPADDREPDQQRTPG